MDPWKISTIALGTLSAALVVACVALWMRPAEPMVPMAPSSTTTQPTAQTSNPSRAEPRPGPAEDIDAGGEPEPVVTLRVNPSESAWLEDPTAPLPPELLDRAREQLEAEARARREDRRAEVRDDIDAFLDEEGVDAPTIERVNDILDRFGGEMRDLRQQVRSGELERSEARSQFQTQREGLQTALDEALGTEISARLQDQLPGRGRGPGSAGPTRGPGVRGL